VTADPIFGGDGWHDFVPVHWSRLLTIATIVLAAVTTLVLVIA